MGPIGHEFEASGRQRTLGGAKKVAAATAHEAAAAAHPPPTQRPPLGRSHIMGTTEPDGLSLMTMQCQGWVHAWRMAKARTCSRSK